jgi:cell division protease FtsH
VAEELLQKEILFQSDLERLIGKRPFDQKPTLAAETTEQAPEVVIPETTEPETPAEDNPVIEPEA